VAYARGETRESERVEDMVDARGEARDVKFTEPSVAA
jgi:hypothetical protein